MKPQDAKPPEELEGSDKDVSSDTPGLWNCFLAAVQFLTRLPVPTGEHFTREIAIETLRRGVLFFPLIGGAIGLTTAIIFVLLCLGGVSSLVAAFVAVGIEAMITGAFHEDALADTADALGGGWSREQILEIMKDSRLGAYGGMALIVGVGIRVSAMAAIVWTSYWWAIVAITAAACVARLAIIIMMATTAPIDVSQSSIRDVASQQTWMTVLIAALVSLPFWAAWLILGFCFAPLVLLFIAGFLAWFRWRIMQRVGGTTGDLLGCAAYITQLIVLIGATL